MTDLSAQILSHLKSRNLPPNQTWLGSILSTLRPTAPLPANLKTAEFRLLTTDITTTLQAPPHTLFPPGIVSPEVQELRIPGPVTVQVLDVEDVGKSRWSQVEALEMEERGETRRGQEVIRVVAEDDRDDGQQQTQGSGNSNGGPNKLLVQDSRGTKVYAFEMESIKGVDTTMPIGTKLVLTDVLVIRGVILLEAKGTEVLGGKVEVWDKKWREERKGVLKEKAELREGMDGVA